MKQITCGTVAIFGVFVLAGCYSYASQDINNSTYDKVQANPVFATMNVGDSDELILRLVNDANNGTLTSYTITGVPAGIKVNPIPNYRDLFLSDTLNPTGDKTAQAYYIDGLTPGRYTFIATPTSVNTGISATITVLVQPIGLGASLSEHSGVAGDTVTITATTGISFTSGSKVSFPTGNFAQIGISPDSSSIKIIAGPGITGPATVTNVGQSSAPTVALKTLVTSDSLTTPALTTAPTTVSNASPDIGVPITVTLGNNLRFTSASQVLVGGTKAGIASVSADSSSAQVVPMAGSTGTVTYTGVVLSFLNTVQLSLTGDKSVTVSSVYGGPTDPNATSVANASTITLTGSRSTVVSNGGGIATPCSTGWVTAFGGGITCEYFKITIPAGNMSGDIRWNATTNDDLGIGIGKIDGSACTAMIADNNGPVLGNVGDDATQPITCAENANATLVAGTYLFTVVSFNEGGTTLPTWIQFRISQP